MTQDPRRLIDDPAAPGLARALREAQGDVLSPEAVARVQAALIAAGVGAASGGGLAAGQGSVWAKLLAARVGVRVGLVGLGLVGLGLAGAALRGPSTHPGAPSAPPEQAVETPPAAAVTTAEPPNVLAAGVPAATTAGTSARPPVTTAEPSRPSAAPAAPSPREGALLLEARRALRADPARALALVRAHTLEFPASQLGPERARIAAEAHQRLEK